MEPMVNKNRTPSRCREWERNRRNKFNDAISRLGDLVKEILRANSGDKDAENVQYKKMEVVEKAIVCLTTCVQEKAQLKAEVLALQVKIDTGNKHQTTKKDVSTQVFVGVSKKSKNDKYVKVVMLQKSKRKALKETTNASAKEANLKPSPKLPMLLPKSNLPNDIKKGPDNTIVVLPAAPYIFNQRPLLLPTVPPAFVLVDQNLQTLNKPTFPLLNRSNSDVTKTTMVNILPISAYSRPLSATKTKGTKRKTESKKIKKPKQPEKVKVPNTAPSKQTDKLNPTADNKEKDLNKISQNEKVINDIEIPSIITTKDNMVKEVSIISTINNKDSNSANVTTTIRLNEQPDQLITEINKVTELITCPKARAVDPVADKTVVQKPINTVNIDDKNKITQKPQLEKEVVDKNKENKLPNLLETALCENTVDAGNARLELAEEFLAASPTAAFLMSFPLVSGNRADSPAEEPPNPIQVNPKDSNQRRNELPTNTLSFFEKSNPSDIKSKTSSSYIDKTITTSSILSSNSSSLNKYNAQLKYGNNNAVTKQDNAKTTSSLVSTNVSNENPFLNLPMSSLLPTACSLSDTTFGFDFDCSISKTVPTQSSSYASNNNFFYKSDPFSTVKSTIYSTSSISSGHEFNSFGLYPCAMEKYSSKNKTDYSNVEDNLMKIGSSRLTYDIDLGWSHKGFDFVNCTSASNTFNKDSILTTTTGSYSSSYNPFTPDFHVPLVSTSSKKDNSTSKCNTSFSDTITSFYSQPTNLWSEDTPFYTSNNNTTAKTFSGRHQNYLPLESQATNVKQNNTKQNVETAVDNNVINKPSHPGVTQQTSEKYIKKSPSKMHINWMTSEVRPMQTNCNPSHAVIKDNHKSNYGISDHILKKHDNNENNYFPISMPNFQHPVQDELQVWPSTRPAGTTEISIEPPPINLPTLVGDLALGPHDKKKITDLPNRGTSQTDIQNCSNFFSVTQLMNRSTDNNVSSRYQVPTLDSNKPVTVKQNISHANNDNNRKPMSHTDINISQPCYVFNNSKTMNTYENMNQFPVNKTKSSKSDKNSKTQKNNYSAEALIRGGTCNQKLQDNNSAKFMIPPQKYHDFNSTQDTSVAQVSHFPAIIDYSDNSYSGQQFSSSNLYNTTTNTIPNSFYPNFMPGSSNLMTGNYASGPFPSEFIDYNQSAECGYQNHKYTELKMRNNTAVFQQDKAPTNYKSSRRESAAKHKLECSKKESKKCQSKRTKLTNELEEWNDSSHLLWQNKVGSKRHSNITSEELPFPNYVGNQMTAAGQYQPDFFNSHIMSSNMQSVGPNVDRSLSTFPATSRANFNLSTIFPEITMKVQ